MSTGPSSSKPSFWSLPVDDFIASLPDALKRQQLSRKLRKQLWWAIALALVAVAFWGWQMFREGSAANEPMPLVMFLVAFAQASSANHRLDLIRVFELLSKNASGAPPGA